MLYAKLTIDVLFGALLVWCSLRDLRTHELPNRYVVIALVIAVLNSALMPYAPYLWMHPLGAVVLTLPFLIGFVRRGIGGADVKMIFAVGWFFGLWLGLAVLAGMLVLCVFALLFRKLRRAGKKPVAMLPLLAAPALIVMVGVYFI